MRANRERLGALEEFDLRAVDFPKLEHYGLDHAQNASQLAWTIGQTLRLTQREARIVRLAGFFHDVGRLQPWEVGDPEAAMRSAVITEGVLRQRVDMERDVIEEVCRLISQHAVGKASVDPRAQALHDADALEEARFAPGTVEGLKRYRAATATLQTAYARQKDIQRRWLTHRGWA